MVTIETGGVYYSHFDQENIMIVGIIEDDPMGLRYKFNTLSGKRSYGGKSHEDGRFVTGSEFHKRLRGLSSKVR